MFDEQTEITVGLVRVSQISWEMRITEGHKTTTFQVKTSVPPIIQDELERAKAMLEVQFLNMFLYGDSNA